MASPSIICFETLIQNQNSESIVKDVKQTENDEQEETCNTQPTFECEHAEATVTRSISSLTKDKTLPKLNKHLTHDKSSKLLIELSKNSQEAEDGNYHFCGSNYYHIQSEFISTMQLFGKVDMKINVEDEYNTISFEELMKKIMDLSDQRLLTANDLDNERIKNQNKRVKNLEISGMFKMNEEEIYSPRTPEDDSRIRSFSTSEYPDTPIHCYICGDYLGHRFKKGVILHMGLEDGEPVCPKVIHLSNDLLEQGKNIISNQNLNILAKYNYLRNMNIYKVYEENKDPSINVIDAVENFLHEIEDQKKKEYEKSISIQNIEIKPLSSNSTSENPDIKYMTDLSEENKWMDEAANMEEEAKDGMTSNSDEFEKSNIEHHHCQPSSLLKSIEKGVKLRKTSIKHDSSNPMTTGKVLRSDIYPRVLTKPVRNLMRQISNPNIQDTLKVVKTIDKSTPFIPKNLDTYFYGSSQSNNSKICGSNTKDALEKKHKCIDTVSSIKTIITRTSNGVVHTFKKDEVCQNSPSKNLSSIYNGTSNEDTDSYSSQNGPDGNDSTEDCLAIHHQLDATTKNNIHPRRVFRDKISSSENQMNINAVKSARSQPEFFKCSSKDLPSTQMMAKPSISHEMNKDNNTNDKNYSNASCMDQNTESNKMISYDLSSRKSESFIPPPPRLPPPPLHTTYQIPSTKPESFLAPSPIHMTHQIPSTKSESSIPSPPPLPPSPIHMTHQIPSTKSESSIPSPPPLPPSPIHMTHQIPPTQSKSFIPSPPPLPPSPIHTAHQASSTKSESFIPPPPPLPPSPLHKTHQTSLLTNPSLQSQIRGMKKNTTKAEQPKNKRTERVTNEFKDVKNDLLAELKLAQHAGGVTKLKNKMAKHNDEVHFEKFLCEVPEHDSNGQIIPMVEREALARKKAEKAKRKALDQKRDDDRHLNLALLPDWKRQLLESKQKDPERYS
nr:uncharacterized protein LOC121126084 isoform X2 [Lepeophtheirus salmonis]